MQGVMKARYETISQGLQSLLLLPLLCDGDVENGLLTFESDEDGAFVLEVDEYAPENALKLLPVAHTESVVSAYPHLFEVDVEEAVGRRRQHVVGGGMVGVSVEDDVEGRPKLVRADAPRGVRIFAAEEPLALFGSQDGADVEPK